MLLSIIIPTHNRFHYLQRCLDALGAEISHADCEIAVIDDGSNKETVAKSMALCRQRGVMYYRLDKNEGAAAARNRGIEMSKGAWTAFLDDDVCVTPGWGAKCIEALHGLPQSVVGIEGGVIATGSGVWDREVENTRGNQYLSCHMFYRKETLLAAGGFDRCFSSRYPSCEDQELAVRMRLWGEIPFKREICVKHLPRKVNLVRYCWDSFYRMGALLDSELYFYLKHRDRYHSVRHATTFWGTYKNIIVRHWYSTIKRRSLSTLAAHPVQSSCLLLSCAMEQFQALVLLPVLLRKYVRVRHQFFRRCMDENRTRELWKIAANASVTALALQPRFALSLLFPLLRKPVYSMGRFLRRIERVSTLTDLRIFLRIDDVFVKNAEASNLCDQLMDKQIPYCAAITGDDLMTAQAEPLIRRIRQSGGAIALHGFSHKGKFGPFSSEVLQMNFLELEGAIDKVFSRLPDSLKPGMFIPPFNAMSRDQMCRLSKRFRVISGGPETARFTDCYCGPVAIGRDSWYFPSFHPFYGAARHILKSNEFKNLSRKKGFLCITVHLSEEAKDGFASLLTMIDGVRDGMTSWEYFYSLPHGERDMA